MDSLSLVALPKHFPNHRFASGLSLCFLKCVRVSASSLALVVSMSSFLSPLLYTCLAFSLLVSPLCLPSMEAKFYEEPLETSLILILISSPNS